jgi:hypothetical protein
MAPPLTIKEMTSYRTTSILFHICLDEDNDVIRGM